MAKPFDPKAKAKRQKILIAVLGVVFLAVMAYQAPTILGVFGGSSSEATTTTPPPPAPVPVAPPTTPGAPPAVAPAAAPAAAGASGLIDSDPTVVPAAGQLVSFDRFESKDPFAQQLQGGGGSEGGSRSGSAARPPARVAKRRRDADAREGFTAPAQRATASVAPARPSATRTAEISVNGSLHEVAAGAKFPSDDPIFKLVSLTRSSAKIGIVGGGYSNGEATVTLRKGGKAVTLMNTADGTTYVLRFVGAS